MAFTKTTITLLLSLITTLVLTTTVSSATNPFCRTADDKALCSQLTKDGKTWAVAMTNALESVQGTANSGKKIVDGIGPRLPANLKPQTKASIESTCRESYRNILDNLVDCIGFVKNDPDSSLKTYLSAISFSDCTDALDEFHVSISEVNDFGNQILKLSSTLLAIAETKP